jgi:hypothetical protein
MRALTYRNTKSTIPNWVTTIHEDHPRGIAYETPSHFVHIYGRTGPLWTISIGLTVTQATVSLMPGTLNDWVTRTFGADDIQTCNLDVGQTIEGVWRPGLFFDDEVQQGLGFTNEQLRLAEQSLLLLIERLNELLLFVEPAPATLATHSHKARELLLLACTEVEAHWQYFLRRSGVTPAGRGFTTNDFVRLSHPLFLPDYEIALPRYSAIPPVRPFFGWSPTAPTQSLPWYQAYNDTKHDRTANFQAASLSNCIMSVAANLVLFAVRFGPYRLYNAAGSLSTLFNEMFSLALVHPNPSSFYAPSIVIPGDQRGDLICFDAQKLVERRQLQPLSI